MSSGGHSPDTGDHDQVPLFGVCSAFLHNCTQSKFEIKSIDPSVDLTITTVVADAGRRTRRMHWHWPREIEMRFVRERGKP